MGIHVYRPKLNQKGNNFSTPNDILMNLHMHHHTLAIYKFMKFLLLHAYQWPKQEKIIGILTAKGQYLIYCQEIMTELHMHYSMVKYTQNKIYEIWSIASLNRGYIDPTDCHWCESADSLQILCAISAAFYSRSATKN